MAAMGGIMPNRATILAAIAGMMTGMLALAGDEKADAPTDSDETRGGLAAEAASGAGDTEYGADVDWDEWLKPPPGEPRPKFVCEESTIDVGRLWATGVQPVDCWWVRNDGKAPLRIRLQHSCCTYPSGPAGIEVPAGERRLIRVGLDVRHVSGSHSKYNVIAHTNDRENRKVPLQAACTVLDTLNKEPAGVIHKDHDRATRRAATKIVLTRADSGPIKPKVVAIEKSVANPDPRRAHTWVEDDGDSVRTKITEIEPGERYELYVTLNAPWPADGYLNRRIRLATGVDEVAEKLIRVVLTTQPRLSCTPRGFKLPPVTDEPIEQRIDLEWSADKPPAKVLAAKATIPGASTRVETGESGQYIVLTAPAGVRVPEKATLEVVLETDDPDCPQLQIPIWRIKK